MMSVSLEQSTISSGLADLSSEASPLGFSTHYISKRGCPSVVYCGLYIVNVCGTPLDIIRPSIESSQLSVAAANEFISMISVMQHLFCFRFHFYNIVEPSN